MAIVTLEDLVKAVQSDVDSEKEQRRKTRNKRKAALRKRRQSKGKSLTK